MLRVIAVILACWALGCSRLERRAVQRQSNDVSFRVTLSLKAEGKTSWLRVVALVPTTISGSQVVRDVSLSPEPLRVFDLNGNRYAEFVFPRPKGELQVQVAGRATLFGYDLSVALAGGGIPETGGLRPWLIPEPGLETDDPEIAKAAAGIKGRSEIEVVKGIYDFVKAHMEFGGDDLSSPGKGAAKALQDGKGDCTEYADLMVALCRAKGIPARPVLGLLALPSLAVPQHSWVEVRTSQYGWVPFDPTADDCSRNATFERLKPAYLIFSRIRNDEMLDNYNSFALFRWWGDRVTLTDKYEVK
jgi:transglutaminase-like putative cysteine protease